MSAPERLTELENEIDRIVGSDCWTGNFPRDRNESCTLSIVPLYHDGLEVCASANNGCKASKAISLCGFRAITAAEEFELGCR